MYNGIKFSKCTDTDHDAQWCATKTDSEGKFMKNEWGNCDVGCPGFRGIKIFIPLLMFVSFNSYFPLLIYNYYNQKHVLSLAMTYMEVT